MYCDKIINKSHTSIIINCKTKENKASMRFKIMACHSKHTYSFSEIYFKRECCTFDDIPYGWQKLGTISRMSTEALIAVALPETHDSRELSVRYRHGRHFMERLNIKTANEMHSIGNKNSNGSFYDICNSNQKRLWLFY